MTNDIEYYPVTVLSYDVEDRKTGLTLEQVSDRFGLELTGDRDELVLAFNLSDPENVDFKMFSRQHD